MTSLSSGWENWLEIKHSFVDETNPKPRNWDDEQHLKDPAPVPILVSGKAMSKGVDGSRSSDAVVCGSHFGLGR